MFDGTQSSFSLFPFSTTVTIALPSRSWVKSLISKQAGWGTFHNHKMPTESWLWRSEGNFPNVPGGEGWTSLRAPPPPKPNLRNSLQVKRKKKGTYYLYLTLVHLKQKYRNRKYRDRPNLQLNRFHSESRGSRLGKSGIALKSIFLTVRFEN